MDPLPPVRADFDLYPDELDTTGAAQLLGIPIAEVRTLAKTLEMPHRYQADHSRYFLFIRDELIDWFNHLPGCNAAEALRCAAEATEARNN